MRARHKRLSMIEHAGALRQWFGKKVSTRSLVTRYCTRRACPCAGKALGIKEKESRKVRPTGFQRVCHRPEKSTNTIWDRFCSRKAVLSFCSLSPFASASQAARAVFFLSVSHHFQHPDELKNSCPLSEYDWFSLLLILMANCLMEHHFKLFPT